MSQIWCHDQENTKARPIGIGDWGDWDMIEEPRGTRCAVEGSSVRTAGTASRALRLRRQSGPGFVLQSHSRFVAVAVVRSPAARAWRKTMAQSWHLASRASHRATVRRCRPPATVRRCRPPARHLPPVVHAGRLHAGGAVVVAVVPAPRTAATMIVDEANAADARGGAAVMLRGGVAPPRVGRRRERVEGT